MADTIYVVSRDEQDQYVRLLDLSDTPTIYAVRDTFRPVLAGRTPSVAQSDSRRGGALQVGERRDTASVGGTFMVKGTTADVALARAESLLVQADSAGPARFVWWQPDGSARVSLYPLLGPAAATVNYTWAQFASGFFPIEISWPCQPWAESPVQDMGDDFRARDTGLTALQQFQRDYSSGVTPTSVAQRALELPASMSAAQARVRRLDRQPWRDGWVTVKGKAKTGAADSERALTPGLRYTPADGKYFFAEIQGGALKVREFDGATIQTRASVAQAAPAVNTSHWIRIRATGTSVIGEYWATAPTPHGTPTQTITYTDPSTLRTGYPMLVSDVMTSGASNIPILESWEVLPYSWRLLDTPATITIEPLPGTMDAAVDLDLTPGGADTDYARHLLLGWRRAKTGTALPQAPATTHTSLLLPGETGATAIGTAVVTDVAKYRGTSGQAMGYTTDAIGGSASAQWQFDPSIFEPDAFASTVTLAVLVRYWRNTGIVTPRLRADLTVAASTARPAPEFGSTGRYLPALTVAGVRSTALGTVTVETIPQVALVTVTLTWAVGSPAAVSFAVDELYLVPVSALALSATGKDRDDGTYQAASAAVSPTSAIRTRRVRRDLAGAFRDIGNEAKPYFATAPLNMGGAQLLLPVASEGVELLVRPSVSVPDDPVQSAVGDILTHNTTVHARVTPRHHLFAA